MGGFLILIEINQPIFYMIVVVRLVSVMLLLHKRMLITKQIQVSLEI